MKRKRWGWAAVGVIAAGCLAGSANAQAPAPTPLPDSRQLIETLIAHELEAGKHRGHYTYISEERSERTNGHLWDERVAETLWGKVRYLVTEDGQPLTGDRLAAERARLAADAADPEAFKRREEARADDEQHARAMLTLLPRAFLFDPPQPEGDVIRVTYRPNPAFAPTTLEERVLRGMSGFVLIDAKAFRTRRIEGRLLADVSIGFGFLATIKAGSNFDTTREPEQGNDWKTQSIHTDFNGKALFLKTIARKQDAKRWAYRKIDDNLTVAQAVKLVEAD